MLGFGPPADRKARCHWWRRQIQRQQEGSLTVAEFCRQLGVSTVTFYAWKRRFRAAPAASPLVSERPSARPMAGANEVSIPAFLPVSILDADAAAGQLGQLEIELANGCIVRLKGAVDPEWLRIAIRAAGRIDGDRRGGD
jgi:transposase-like protein